MELINLILPQIDHNFFIPMNRLDNLCKMISRFAYNYLQCTLNRERFFSPYDFEGFKAATTRVAPSTVPRAPYLVYFNGVARYSFPRNSAP